MIIVEGEKEGNAFFRQTDAMFFRFMLDAKTNFNLMSAKCEEMAILSNTLRVNTL